MSVSALNTLDAKEYLEDLKKCETMRKHSGTTLISETMSITWQGDKPNPWHVRTETAHMKEQERRSVVQLRLLKRLQHKRLVGKIEAGVAQGSQHNHASV